MYVPAAGKLTWAVAPLASSNWPSLSRSQARAAIVPSESVEVSVSWICWPGIGAAGLAVNDAVGAWFGGGPLAGTPSTAASA